MAGRATLNPEAVAFEAVLRVKLRRAREAKLALTAGAREDAQQTLRGFCHWTYPAYMDSPHLELLDAALEDVEAGRCDRLMVFMPPRHGKSEKISVRFPAWYLCRNPARKIISANFDEDLAGEAGRQVRNIVATQSLFPEVKLAQDSKARSFWHTQQGGQYLAVGVGSSIIGFGGNLIIIDDPHGKANIVTSLTQREHSWQWYTTELYNRREPGAAIVLVMHRWHEDDLAGRALAAEPGRWRVIRLPAIAERGDELGRAEGQPLWAARFPADELVATRSVVGEREWNAKYQQRPAPEEGAVFKWFPTYDPVRVPALRKIVIPIDTALGGEDATAAAAWGWDGGKAYLLDAMSYKGDAPEAERRVQYFHQKQRMQHPGVAVLPLHRDNVHIDKIMAQHLRAGVPSQIVQNGGRQGNGHRDTRMGMPVGGVRLPAMGGSSQDKREALGRMVSVEFEGGRALVPEGGFAPWLEGWLEEHKSFPYGAHDDYVETTIIALWHLFRAAPTVRAEQPIKLYGRY